MLIESQKAQVKALCTVRENMLFRQTRIADNLAAYIIGDRLLVQA